MLLVPYRNCSWVEALNRLEEVPVCARRLHAPVACHATRARRNHSRGGIDPVLDQDLAIGGVEEHRGGISSCEGAVATLGHLCVQACANPEDLQL